MKKSTFLAFGFALLASTAFAQNAQEVTYVEDASQGYLFNRFQDNWFIQLEAGAGMGFSHMDSERAILDRFMPAAHLNVGKWFSPILGARIGVDAITLKGVASDPVGHSAVQYWNQLASGNYKSKEMFIGPSLDVMLSLTNWWCGYKPNRVYNAYIYAGGGGYFSFVKGLKDGTADEYVWKNADDKCMQIHLGLTQDFNITKNFALGLDLRATAIPNSIDYNGTYTMFNAEALLTATYKFNKATWAAPVVPVCPVAENCDEYRARLQAADARIADLEAQLKACLARPIPEPVVVTKAPLATIYYPCNVYSLTSVDRKVLQSVANVMKADGKNYTLTGWADNYTGTDAINTRLRENRVNTVKNQLVKYGVPASQLNATTNNGNRTDLGEKCLTLDRCVTIEEN